MAANHHAPDTLFTRIFHASPVAMTIHSQPDGRFVDANEACARLLGYSRPELIGGHSVELELLSAALHAQIAAADHRPVDPLRLRSRDGADHEVVVTSQPAEWDGRRFAISLLQDLTNFNRASAALRESEARFRRFFAAIPLPVVVFDAETLAILEVNDMAVAQYGYDRAALLDQPITLLWPPEERPALAAALRADAPAGPMCHQRRDGTMLDVEAAGRPILLGERAARLTTFSDVTEQRANEAARRRSEEQLRIIADVTTDVIWEFDPARQTAVYSGGMKTLFGHDAGPRPAPDWWLSLIHPDDHDRVLNELRAAIPHYKGLWNSQYRFRRADGSYAHVLDRGYALQDEAEGLRVVGAIVDITRQIELQEAASRAAEAERRRLARDLHDAVTQSVYSLTLMTEAARRRAMLGDERAAFDYVDRLGELARQALKEMRLLVYELRPAALEDESLVPALQARLDAVEQRAGVQARLLVEAEHDLPVAVQAELFRVAEEALNNTLKHAAATAVDIIIGGDDQRLLLEIRDNGRGFGPLPAGAPPPSGLGLVSMRERVDNLGGALEVETSPGKGTTVRVTLELGNGDNGKSDPHPHL